MYKRRCSILIIDDQETIITMLTKILEEEYVIHCADNGKDGIELAEKVCPDVILLDILMLDMDGFEVLEQLKNREATKEIPVIFLTSLKEDINEEKGLALGAVDYIRKPFSASIVRLRVHNRLKIIEQMRTIEQLSMIDQLTDIPNRRNFEERIKSEWGRALRDQLPISILIIDLDKFKQYNDKYGHQQGDALLVAVANVFKETLKRPGDFAARWGGEEFIVLMQNTDLAGAQEIAEKIRSSIEKLETMYQGKTVTKITASIGINSRKRGQSSAINEFISRADLALYEAKNSGRNRSCVFKEDA
ncbi:MAG: diguanylate cyclase [Treponema sp.]|nr:diguanylate cyclase [Treponema sp.]MCL2237504.1 diguanylate cyclase [Treponema sp.]